MGLKTKIKNNKIIVSLIRFERKIFGINKIKVGKESLIKVVKEGIGWSYKRVAVGEMVDD